MPPKKQKIKADTDAANTNSDAGEAKFSWTPENDRLLLILTMGRTLSTDDYNRLVEAMPGTNYNGVRIRVSKMRVEQRKKFEDLGWGEPKKATVKTGAKAKGPAKPRKRKAGDEEGGEDVEVGAEMPGKAKKMRAKKGEGKGKGVKSEERIVDDDEEGEGVLNDEEVGVEV